MPQKYIRVQQLSSSGSGVDFLLDPVGGSVANHCGHPGSSIPHLTQLSQIPWVELEPVVFATVFPGCRKICGKTAYLVILGLFAVDVPVTEPFDNGFVGLSLGAAGSTTGFQLTFFASS